jgi:hypothetical protein
MLGIVAWQFALAEAVVPAGQLTVGGILSPQKPVRRTVPQLTGTTVPATLVVKLMLPLFGPIEVQVMRTVTGTLRPAGTIIGRAGSTAAKAAGSLELIASMMSGWFPVLSTIKVWSLVVPAQRSPKSRDGGLTAQATCVQKPETATGLHPTSGGAVIIVIMPL